MSKEDSVKAKLKNLAEKEKKQFDYLLMLYMIERLLYRLSISKYINNFVLKGGLFLYTIFDEKARVTKDIDLLARQIANTLEELRMIFTEICSINIDDAINFDISTLSVEKIKEDADYEGVRIKVTAYLDKSRKVLQFDIGFGDVIVPKAIDMDYPSLLDMEKPRIKAYSIESVIAEKFEAMIYLAETNSRMKDFYDIYSLCTNFDFDGRVLYEAINQTFIRRATPLSKEPIIFSNGFILNKDKNIQWIAFKRRIGEISDITFEQILNTIIIFIKPIYSCIIDEDEFFGHWDKVNLSWTNKEN